MVTGNGVFAGAWRRQPKGKEGVGMEYKMGSLVTFCNISLG